MMNIRFQWGKDKEKEKVEFYDDHYGGDSDMVQPIELMQDQMSQEAFSGALLFNIIKYCSRFGKKDDPVKEAHKILRYAEWLVDVVEDRKINPRE